MLKLTRAQKEKLKAGEPVPIRGDGDCPVRVGEVLEQRGFTLRVLRVDPHRGGWALRYELTVPDHVRLLRRTPPAAVVKADGRAPTPDVIRKAAQESAYTERLTNTVSDAGEAVDEKSQERYARESEQDRVRRIADYEKTIRDRPLHEQLEEALEEARRSGVETTRYEDRIVKGIEAIRRRTRRDAA